MDHNTHLEALVIPTLDSLGFELVRVRIQGRQRPTVQVMAEPKEKRPMTVEDCARISRSLSAVLDVEDPISGAYVLEVSSPGIDRPLTRTKDFVEWAGFEAKMEADPPVDGRKRFKGKLLGLDEHEQVGLLVETGEEVRIPLSSVKSARLVLTDDLIAAVTAAHNEIDDESADPAEPN